MASQMENFYLNNGVILMNRRTAKRLRARRINAGPPSCFVWASVMPAS